MIFPRRFDSDQNPLNPQICGLLGAKWPITTTITAVLLPRLTPLAAATPGTAAAHHPIFRHRHRTRFFKPLLGTFSNLFRRTTVMTRIFNLRSPTPAIFIPRVSTNTSSGGLKTRAFKKFQGPILLSPPCFSASMLWSPRSSIFRLHLRIALLLETWPLGLSKPISVPSLFAGQGLLDSSKSLHSSSPLSTLSNPLFPVDPNSSLTLFRAKSWICFSGLTLFRVGIQ